MAKNHSSNGNDDCVRNAIHISLQGKGGVGKSLAASLLAQYLLARGHSVRCVDTDPVNKTLTQYRALGADPLPLLREGAIDQRGFDCLMERLLSEDANFVVDNGASTFIPLWHYMLENNVPEMLSAAGKNLYLHMVITGGQALADTVKGFGEIAQTAADLKVVVWINEYFGRVEYDGKEFPDMKVYQEHQAKVFGCVLIPKRNQDTFGRDVEEVVSRKLTLEEALRDGAFSIMTKQRLKVVQRHLFEQLDTLSFV